MAIGMIGTMLAGAAEGYAANDKANVEAANRQIEAENLVSQQGYITGLLDNAKLQMQFQIGLKVRAAMQDAIQTGVPKILAEQGKVVDPSYLTPEMMKAGWQPATMQDRLNAASLALTEAGFPQSDEVLKAASSVMGSQNAMQGQAVRGIAAENVRAGSDIEVEAMKSLSNENIANIMAHAKIDVANTIPGTNMQVTQPGGALASPATIAPANSPAAAGAPALPNGAGGMRAPLQYDPATGSFK